MGARMKVVDSQRFEDLATPRGRNNPAFRSFPASPARRLGTKAKNGRDTLAKHTALEVEG